ncbi:TRAP transporter small permease [Treponema parvum]|uniref:TRAP transporter small permease n=1 Tax=Treponema parvum TaxID=138851 RepID=A0A975EYV2_9SPIR|nr:TRAP transporter small permease [Treponema parvum]QTQ11242.1 TRAP transporter small permease [Treponema parvum]QTQ16824.1 TRAP transporter small permease [Treponema parvum]
MKFDKKDLLSNFELYLGGFFIACTVVITIANVFTRYCLGFTFFWNQEVALIGFVWTIFLGAAGAFKHRMMMGVDFLLQVTHGKVRKTIRLAGSVFVLIITSTMLSLSTAYILRSQKITPVLQISYKWLNLSIILSFVLITIYAIKNVISEILIFIGKRPEPSLLVEENI